MVSNLFVNPQRGCLRMVAVAESVSVFVTVAESVCIFVTVAKSVSAFEVLS